MRVWGLQVQAPEACMCLREKTSAELNFSCLWLKTSAKLNFSCLWLIDGSQVMIASASSYVDGKHRVHARV